MYVNLASSTQQTLFQAAALLVGGLIGLLLLDPKGPMDRAPFFALASAIWLLFDIAATAALWHLNRDVSFYSGGLLAALLLGLAPALFAGLAFGALAAARARAIFGQAWFALLAFVPLIGLFFVVAKTRKTGPKGPLNMPVFLTGSHGVQLGLLFGGTHWLFTWLLQNYPQVSPYSM